MAIEQILAEAYRAFNARDIDTVLSLMHPDVDWPNCLDNKREQGHENVRAYWVRQFQLINSRVEPQKVIHTGDEQVTVDVHQVVRSPEGEILADQMVQHVYRFQDGLIRHMDIVAPNADTSNAGAEDTPESANVRA
jgi:uncharacterized protein (TIGR02246 family)